MTIVHLQVIMRTANDQFILRFLEKFVLFTSTEFYQRGINVNNEFYCPSTREEVLFS